MNQNVHNRSILARCGGGVLVSFVLVALFLVPRQSTAQVAASAPPVAQDGHAGKPIVRQGTRSVPGVSGPSHAPSSDLDTGRVILALGIVLGLIFLLKYLGKKLFPSTAAAGRGQVVKVLSRCTLAPRQQILLLQIGRRIVVVGESGSQFNALAQITDAEEVAALLSEIRNEKSPLIGRPFGALLGKARGVFSHPGAAEDPAESDDAAPSDSPLAEPRAENMDIPADSHETAVGATHSEIRHLTDRVRNLARQLGSE